MGVEVAGDGGGEELGFVDDDEHGVPMVALDLEQAAQEGGGAAELVLGVEAFEVEDGGDAVDADALAGGLQLRLGMRLGVDHEVAEAGEGDEVALGVEDGLLHPGAALFEQAAQEVRLAGAGVALDEKAGREEFLEVEGRRGAGRGASQLDGHRHVGTRSLLVQNHPFNPRARASATGGLGPPTAFAGIGRCEEDRLQPIILDVDGALMAGGANAHRPMMGVGGT